MFPQQSCVCITFQIIGLLDFIGPRKFTGQIMVSIQQTRLKYTWTWYFMMRIVLKMLPFFHVKKNHTCETGLRVDCKIVTHCRSNSMPFVFILFGTYYCTILRFVSFLNVMCNLEFRLCLMSYLFGVGFCLSSFH